MGRSRFGSIRKRGQGRYVVTYRHQGREHRGPTSFVSHADAKAYLAVIEADIHKGAWIDPSAGRVTVGEYGAQWINERVTLRPRTRELYKRLLAHQIAPHIGKRTIAELTPSEVRTWHAELAKDMPSTAAKAYRVLATMMRTALEDGLITQTPCRIRGAGNEKAKERPVASVEEVTQIVALVPERYRALILLTAWAGLRRGEVLALERQDLDLVNGKVRIERAVQHMTNGEYYIGPPKTTAGARTVHFPKEIIPAIESHLATFSSPGKTGLVFPGEVGGAIIRPHVLYKHWHRATLAIGRPELRFHDLRHTGATWAAVVGGTTRELMKRLGHASPAAALRYQHATAERDRSIAEALGRLMAPTDEL